MKLLLVAALVLTSPAHLWAANCAAVIRKSYPQYQLFANEDFESYLLKASKEPAIVRGRFRGSAFDCAALIRSRAKHKYKTHPDDHYYAKVVVCDEKGAGTCVAAMEFETFLPYQARLIVGPKDKSMPCGMRALKAGMPPDVLALCNDDKTMLIELLFQSGRFSRCFGDEGEAD